MGKLGQDRTMWKGDDKILAFNIEDATDLEEGYSATWVMCEEEPNAGNSYNPTALLTKTTEDDPVTITFDGATVLVEVDGDDTGEASSIDPGEYYHELKLYDDDGNEAVSAVGTIDLRAPKTKRAI